MSVCVGGHYASGRGGSLRSMFWGMGPLLVEYVWGMEVGIGGM